LIVVAVFWLGDHSWLIVAAVVAAALAGLVAPGAWMPWALPALLTAGLTIYGVVEFATYDDYGRGEAGAFLFWNVAISVAPWFGAGVGVVLRAARVKE
jgi:hypothetical protein